MDPATVARLVAEHPERYRGGTIDRHSPIGHMVTTRQAWERAVRCLDDDNRPRAAYWAGWATAGEGQ